MRVKLSETEKIIQTNQFNKPLINSSFQAPPPQITKLEIIKDHRLRKHMFFDLKNAHFEKINSHIKYVTLQEKACLIISIIGIEFTVFFILLSFLSNLIQYYLTEKNEGSDKYVVVLTMILLVIIYNSIYKMNQLKNRTQFYSQNTSPSRHDILQALLKINEVSPTLYRKWQKKIKMHDSEKIITHLQKHLKEGMCFGYTIAAIEALGRYPDIHSRKLVGSLSYQIVVEKSILQLLILDITKIDSFFCIENKYSLKALRLAYHTPYTDYINNAYEQMNVEETTAQDMLTLFNKQASSLSFIRLPHYRRNGYLNSAKKCFNEDEMLLPEEKKHIRQLKKDLVKGTENMFTGLAIDFFKQKLNLSKRINDYIFKHLAVMSEDTILAGEVILHVANADINHSIMFRHSNGRYYFIDSNFGADEFKSSPDFFEGLRHHLMQNYYSLARGSLTIGFIMHALNTKNQLHTFEKKPNPCEQVEIDRRVFI